MAASGGTDLRQLLKDMTPTLHDGEYVFSTVAPDSEQYSAIPRHEVLCEFKELEGVTLVLSKQTAEAHCVEYSYVASWITLEVHSALEAVGLTAAFATALGKVNLASISG